MDLVQWLRDQLDEDRRVAEAARGNGEGRWHHETGYYVGRVEDERGRAVVYDEGGLLEEEAAHIVAHDPARVLREIDAKRKLLDAYAEVAANDINEVEYAHGWANALGHAVRLLALAYADRPGYREEWRP